MNQDNKTATPTPANDNHGITLGSYVRFDTIDNVETYKVDAVNSSTGVLTLNRGYRGSTNGSEDAFKSTINEIPVGYVAIDVQKVQYNANAGNSTWTSGASFNTDLGRYSCVYNGNAYYSAQLAAASGTVTAGSTAPTHTTGTVSDGAITWSYIGPVDTRLYLYGYNSAATKPPYKLQGFNIGARKQDVLYVSLIEASATVTFAALITPDGTASPADSAYTNITTQNFTPGDPNHPLQFDSLLNTWYVKVTPGTSGSATVQAATGYRGIHYHLGNDSFYANALFTGASYMQRIPDNRSSRDRTYRVRYEVDSSPSALSREPINGYVIQPRNVPTGQSYGDVYYIYDIKTEQELIKSVQNGIYYMTVIKGSISPSNANVDQFSFSQNINNLYPVLDKDNPIEDPNEATSIASNTTVGLVTTTDINTGLEDKSLSITKEVINDYILENRNSYVNSSTNDPAVANYITLEARDGESNEVDKNERMIPVNNTGGTQTELRRPSILRSGNHTFEYVGFGPGNYSTGLPSVQNRVLTDEETLLAQSQKENGGIAFYSGLNSNGDLFIGNTRISAVTGEEASLDTPSLSIVGETANLRPVFDEIIVRDKITVDDANLESVFKGFLSVNQDLNVAKSITAEDITITGETADNEGVKKFDVVTALPGAGTAANNGDYALLNNVSRGSYLGWYWNTSENAWVKMGLSDTGNLNISGGSGATDATGDLQLKNGLGLDIQSTGTLNVNSGNTTLGGGLTVAGLTEINGITNIDNNFSVRSGTTVNFSVASSTGNIASNGSLTVNGNVDLGTSTTNSLTINSVVDSDIIPSGTGATYNLGSSAQKWGTVHCTAINGPTSLAVANITGNVTGNVTGSSGSCTGNSATASALQSAVNIGGVSFDGSTSINLPGVNTAGNQDTSGNAASATQVYVTETTTAQNYPLVFTDSLIAANSGYMGLQKDDNSLFWNPSANTLTLATVACANITSTNGFGTASQNAYGARTVSTGNPTGGSDGDIWYKY